MSGLVGNPDDRFSRVAAHFVCTFELQLLNHAFARTGNLITQVLSGPPVKYRNLENFCMTFIQEKCSLF